MRSMTGFGVGQATVGSARLVAEVRSVNGRLLEVKTRLAPELAELGLLCEQIVRTRVRRGRVEVALRAEGELVGPARLDEARARDALRDLARLRDEVAPSAELPLSLLAVVPGLFAATSCPNEGLTNAAKEAVSEALSAFLKMADAEGARLLDDLHLRLASVELHLAALGSAAAPAKKALRDRLRERVARLVAEAGVTVSAERLEAEVVLFTERGDFTEELTRLASHTVELRAGLAASAHEPSGRRLDFLLQEMLREANTLAAKANDASLTHSAVAIKVELERLREQVQNVE